MRPVVRAMVDGLCEEETHVGGGELALAVKELTPSIPLLLHVGAQGGHGRRRPLLAAHDFLILDPAPKPNVAPHQVGQGRVDGAVRARSRGRQLLRRQLQAAVDQPQGRPDVVAYDHPEMVHPGRERTARTRLPHHCFPPTAAITSTSFPSGSST